MPSRVCDNTPCSGMSKALGTLIFQDGESLKIRVEKKDKTKVTIALQYCPFCGTRVSADFIETIL